MASAHAHFVLLLALGGSSWPSQMHKVTYDFLVVHIKASQKSLGDKPKSVYIFLQTPHEVYTSCISARPKFSLAKLAKLKIFF